MKLHKLKFDSEIIDMKIRGVKNFEIRFNDRNFEVGDILFEREYKQETRKYGTLCLFEKITSILPKKKCYGLEEGYVILVTQPLYMGNYHHIEDFVSYDEYGISLVSYLAKALQVEDYCIWERLHIYDWEVIKNFAISKMPEGKCINMLYKRL